MTRRVIILGNGEAVMAPGEMSGYPCIALSEAKYRGEIGESAEDHREHLEENGVLIVFASTNGAIGLLDVIKQAIDNFASKYGLSENDLASEKGEQA